eukprot:gene9113-23920_t
MHAAQHAGIVLLLLFSASIDGRDLQTALKVAALAPSSAAFGDGTASDGRRDDRSMLTAPTAARIAPSHNASLVKNKKRGAGSSGRTRRSWFEKSSLQAREDLWQSPTCTDGTEEGELGKPVARVAIALYGLFRHPCGAYNFPGIFLEPLKQSTKYRYVVDVITHANIAVHEDGSRSFIPGHSTDQSIAMPSLMFMKFNPCKFDTTDQDRVDAAITPTLTQTCFKYGDYWDGHSKECRTTRNYFRALYSQHIAAELIRSRQEKVGVRYDVVAVVRPDVVFTSKMDVARFDTIVSEGRQVRPNQLVFVPSWADWGGVNDRFMFGHAGPVLAAMSRLNNVVAYVNHLGAEEKPIHSESYMKWTLDRYFEELQKYGGGVKGEVQTVDELHFRRVRSDGFLVPNQYGGQSGIDRWSQCRKNKLEALFPVASTGMKDKKNAVTPTGKVSNAILSAELREAQDRVAALKELLRLEEAAVRARDDEVVQLLNVNNHTMHSPERGSSGTARDKLALAQANRIRLLKMAVREQASATKREREVLFLVQKGKSALMELEEQTEAYENELEAKLEAIARQSSYCSQMQQRRNTMWRGTRSLVRWLFCPHLND